jgi:hypothetical protein
MSELRTNRIIPRDGLPSGSSGGVIQVVSNTFTGTWSGSSGNFTFDTVTDLNTTITPTRSDSKILVMVNVGAWESSGSNQRGGVRLFRGGALIGAADAAGSRPRCNVALNSENSNDVTNRFSICHLDSPATTSAVTYSIASGTEGNYTTYINRSAGDADSGTVPRASSSITLMELSG